MIRPLVSIALCTYNGEKFLSEQLDSILCQSYSNLDIIIVDDCSTDNTYKILEEYAQNDVRIRLFKNESNLGFNKNFEKALSLTKGEYIAISDQDDIWKPIKIEQLIKHINGKWVVFSNSCLIDEFGNELKKTLLNRLELQDISFKSILLGNFVTGHTMLMKREFLNFCIPIPVTGYYDWYMGFVALYHNKISYINEALTYYRIHSESVMRQEQLLSLTRKGEKELSYNLIVSHLRSVSLYRYLSAEDRMYIIDLLEAFEKKKEKFSFALFNSVISNYKSLFSLTKSRSGLSLINFAYKFSKRSTDNY